MVVVNGGGAGGVVPWFHNNVTRVTRRGPPLPILPLQKKIRPPYLFSIPSVPPSNQTAPFFSHFYSRIGDAHVSPSQEADQSEVSCVSAQLAIPTPLPPHPTLFVFHICRIESPGTYYLLVLDSPVNESWILDSSSMLHAVDFHLFRVSSYRIYATYARFKSHRLMFFSMFGCDHEVHYKDVCTNRQKRAVVASQISHRSCYSTLPG